MVVVPIVSVCIGRVVVVLVLVLVVIVVHIGVVVVIVRWVVVVVVVRGGQCSSSSGSCCLCRAGSGCSCIGSGGHSCPCGSGGSSPASCSGGSSCTTGSCSKRRVVRCIVGSCRNIAIICRMYCYSCSGFFCSIIIISSSIKYFLIFCFYGIISFISRSIFCYCGSSLNGAFNIFS